MPTRNDHLYTQFLRMIAEGEAAQVTKKILELEDKSEQIYTVSRLYKGIYPHIDKAVKMSAYNELDAVLKTIEANAFLFDLALSVIDKADLGEDIRSDLQHAVTLKRMLAHAFKEAIDLDYPLMHELMLELDAARAILQTIISSLQAILQNKS